MQYAVANKEKLIDLYVNQKMSMGEIAKILKTNLTKVRRSLIFLGVEIRSWSESQKLALQSGRAKHPTKGQKLGASTKDKISVARSESWGKMDKTKKEEFVNMKKEWWAALPEAEKHRIKTLAHEAIRHSAEYGSKTERFVSAGLEDEGYSVIVHARDIITNAALEVDLLLPELRTVIEIDGPSHFLPIWGEAKLKKQQKSDTEKQSLLLKHGFCIIRVKQLDRTMSVKRMKDVYSILIDELRKIEEQFPDEKNRLIEIEVADGKSRRI